MASKSGAASSTAASATGRSARGSIHTPLTPASVQDLKAKFDPGKATDGGGGTASTMTASQKANRVKTSSPLSERKGSAGSSLSKDESSNKTGSRSSSSVSLSVVNSSLQAAAQRKLGTTSSSSSNLRSASKTSVALTTAQPFSPSSLSSSKSGSASSSGRSSPCLDNSSSATNKWELRSTAKPASSSNTAATKRTGSQANISISSSELRNSFHTNRDQSLELPIMQISTSGSEATVETRLRGSTMDNKLRGSCEKRSGLGSSHIDKKVTERKSDFASNSSSTRQDKNVTKENSPPIQRSSKLVAREIKIERLDSGVSVTSYKDSVTSSAATTSSAAKPAGSSVAMRNNTKEAKAAKVSTEPPTSSTKNNNTKLEFAQVKLRKTKMEQPKDASKLPSNLKVTNSDAEEKRISCKINSERFERLMFDFQRGVPTETIIKQGSETDHIELQQKARELSKPAVEDDVPVIAKKKKEPSIFTEGLKVSDFVKQVNKLNPESEGPRKWKVQRGISQTSSAASSDVGGDNFYQGIPGEDTGNVSDEQDDIYEKVTNRAVSLTDGEPEGEFTKTPGRRLGVYRKQRGSKKKVGKNRAKLNSDCEERATQSDGGGCDQGEWSSSGTEYEDVSPDVNDLPKEGEMCLYEDLENFSKPTSEVVKNKTITHKLKKIFYKTGSKNKKNKSFVDLGVSASTESEADTVDDVDETDNDLTETFSRTSSQRSSGRRTRDSAVLSSISLTTSTSATTASNVDETPAAGSAVNHPQTSMGTSNIHPPPALPPRTTKALSQSLENSPPLPPRNQSSIKTTLSNPQDIATPISPTGKSSGRRTDKTKDILSIGGNSQDGCDAEVPASGKAEHIDHESGPALPLDKLERSDSTSRKRRSLFGRKTGGAGQPVPTTSSTSATSYTYPDISAFPELKGDHANLYVDLEDEQIYGKASDFYISKFESEPLYQWYSKDKVIQNMCSDKSTSDDLSSDDEYLEERRRPESLYEDVEKLLEKSNTSISITKPTSGSKDTVSQDPIKPRRRSVIEDVFRNGGSLHRALWCQMPQVIKSGILTTLTDQEKKLQEAMFEIITSEASYLKSLKVLISVFLMAPEFSAEMSDKCVINRREKQILFSNIGHIKDVSEEFLKDLEDRWQESCYIKDICDIIYKHASQKFEAYVRYCGNQAFQDKAFNTLRLNPEFTEAVKRLEQHPDCQLLPFASFLLLPMQRITRMPLLIDAVCHRLDLNSPALAGTKKAMDSITKVAKRCDDAAKKMQQTEQICLLKSNLEFKVKEFPLISASRFLVKQGELTQIKVEGTVRKPLSKLLGSNKEHVYLFLFNDILLVTKKKGTIFQVRDYCQRNSLHIESIDNPDKSHHIAPGTATGIPNILFLAMLANHENRQVEMVLSCKSESERTRWIDAIMPTQTSSESERVYDCWGEEEKLENTAEGIECEDQVKDCPQFHAVRKYIAQQPDELNLEESDVINVTRKMADGWYEGERIRDGEKGWFLASHTEEINNSHVRARNLRLRYRLMMASQEYSQMELHKK